MGKMKSNRKFVEEEEAVSAVIGVILMVAITVAIAATVYVYVSGMLGSGPSASMTVSMVQTSGFVSIQNVEGGPLTSPSKITFVNATGILKGNGTWVDTDYSGTVTGGDTIQPPAGLIQNQVYTVTMIYANDAIGTCKFTAP